MVCLSLLQDQKEKITDSTGSSPTSSTASFLLENASLEVDEISTDVSSEPSSKHSRLSKPLVEIMRDSEAFGYFVQYLDSVNVTMLAKSLLDIDNFNASLTTNSSLLLWENVKGFRRLVDEVSGAVTWEFSNGIGYTNNVACDISGHCRKNVPSSRTIVRAASEARLTEMQRTEQEVLVKMFASDGVSESTVDALRIFYKYFSYVAPFKILLSPHVFQKLMKNLSAEISRNTFGEVRDLIFTALEKEFYNEYLRSECHCKYQMSILTGSEVTIADILYNQSALFYFMEFLENEGGRGMLEFWMAANNFQEQYLMQGQTYDPVQAQSDAMVLYDKFFSLQATQPLHLGDKVRCLVEESICREEGPLPTCFESVQALIVRTLQTRCLAPFLQSQLYFKFLSELISTVNAGPARSGGSDCSSEVSISMTNTLLVSEDGGGKKDQRSWAPSDLSIDARQLYDPDSLWRRGRPTGLQLGRVNALGRFQTDLEPEPDRKQGLESRITKAVKRLVKLEEDKSKEEMAWQVAEMIVKDVTSLTMPSTDH